MPTSIVVTDRPAHTLIGANKITDGSCSQVMSMSLDGPSLDSRLSGR